MRCHVCGATLQSTFSDLPFKLGPQRIAILKNLPVLQCESCGEYLLEDSVLEGVEQLLAKVDASAELEILRYAA